MFENFNFFYFGENGQGPGNLVGSISSVVDFLAKFRALNRVGRSMRANFCTELDQNSPKLSRVSQIHDTNAANFVNSVPKIWAVE